MENEHSLIAHIHNILREYALTRLTRNHSAYTHELAIDVSDTVSILSAAVNDIYASYIRSSRMLLSAYQHKTPLLLCGTAIPLKILLTNWAVQRNGANNYLLYKIQKIILERC